MGIIGSERFIAVLFLAHVDAISGETIHLARNRLSEESPMVTYELVQRDDDTLRYEYWPEGDRASEPGVFVVDLKSETAHLERPAGKDFLCRTTGSEMNALRDSINRMREESGKPPLKIKRLQREKKSRKMRNRIMSGRHANECMPYFYASN